MANLCIIPARGGSKRIPRKNIRLFLDQPIIRYSINLALECKIFDTVMVSTENDEIAKIALDNGAEIPFKRSPKTADDFSTTADVILEVIEQYQKRGKEFQNICCLYPCAPLITADNIKKAWALFIDEEYDMLLPIVRYNYPIQRSLIKVGELIRFKYPKNIVTRTQDLLETYHDAGQFYLMNEKKFSKDKSLVNENTGYIELSEREVHDIDDIEDWKIAEMKYRVLHDIK